ncbi:MAG TPA: AraC family transcriptional regulator [Gemmatimonadales bacterium]|nr:AraC family transcriptional regulator [Gemmatimonadales bacterium]
MPVVAALLESRDAAQALRRSLPRSNWSLARCRNPNGLRKVLATRLVDAIVLTPQALAQPQIQEVRAAFPGVPMVAFGPFRPDDGEMMLACHEAKVAALLVEGVDNAVSGEVVLRVSAAEERRRTLADAPRALRLTDPVQRDVWNYLLERVDQTVRTGALAQRLKISREHLSRQFGAGGAPNLKRVIDLTRIACAAQLLRNPGYDAGTTARLLRFATSSHLTITARRIAGASASGLASMGPRGVLAAFARGNTRSRIR